GEFRNVHSLWFGLVSELGYPGLFLYIAILFTSLWACWRVSGAAKKDPSMADLRHYSHALSTALLVHCVGSTFLSAQYSEMPWHIFGVAFALQAIAATERASAPVGAPEPVRRMSPILAR